MEECLDISLPSHRRNLWLYADEANVVAGHWMDIGSVIGLWHNSWRSPSLYASNLQSELEDANYADDNAIVSCAKVTFFLKFLRIKYSLESIN